MNLVQIRSHDAPKSDTTTSGNQLKIEKYDEVKAASSLTEEAKGFALTVKESVVDSILKVCE